MSMFMLLFKTTLQYAIVLGTVMLMTGFLLYSSPKTGDDDKTIIAKILKEETSPGHYSFTATLENQEASSKEFFYRLKAEKTGKSGTSNSNQSGGAMVKPGKTVNLSNLTLNLDSEDQWKVILDIYHDDLHIAADTLSHTP